jgi:hypothetical protein
MSFWGWLFGESLKPSGPTCPECGDCLPHTEIKLVQNRYAISVRCHRGAMEMNQVAIKKLLKLAGLQKPE